jgi:hypothetical protein
MCQFISAIKDGDRYFYLTGDDLMGWKFAEYKKYNPGWMEDICGHGAIEFFYPELKGRREHWECDDFSNPENFPACIVRDIKGGMLDGIGICPDILTEERREEYYRITNSAWDEYNRIKKYASRKYDETLEPAKDDRGRIIDTTWHEYNKIFNFAGDEYNRIVDTARNEYCWTINSAFWIIAKQAKSRKDIWK